MRFDQPYRARNPRTGREEEYPRYLHSYLLEAGGKRYVVLASYSIPEPRIALHVGQELSRGNAGELIPFDRLAEVGLSANSLEITVDDYEYPTVRWREGDGRRRAVLVSPDRTKVQEIQ